MSTSKGTHFRHIPDSASPHTVGFYLFFPPPCTSVCYSYRSKTQLKTTGKGRGRCKLGWKTSFACLLKILNVQFRSAAACWEDGLVTSYQFTPRPLFVPLLLVWSQECFCGSFAATRYVLQSSREYWTSVHSARLGAIPAFVNLFPEQQKTGSRARPAQLHQGQKSNFSEPKNVSFSRTLDQLLFLCFSILCPCKSNKAVGQKLIVWFGSNL